jgi:hypothetical protein
MEIQKEDTQKPLTETANGVRVTYNLILAPEGACVKPKLLKNN